MIDDRTNARCKSKTYLPHELLHYKVEEYLSASVAALTLIITFTRYCQRGILNVKLCNLPCNIRVITLFRLYAQQYVHCKITSHQEHQEQWSSMLAGKPQAEIEDQVGRKLYWSILDESILREGKDFAL
jgi:hypothetical protein